MLVVGVLLAGCGPTPDQQRVAQILQLVGDADAGGTVFNSTCSGCHGKTNPTCSRKDTQTVVSTVISGTSAMPAQAHLSDQQIADVAAFCVGFNQGRDGGP